MFTFTTDQMALFEQSAGERLLARLEQAVLQVFPDVLQPLAEAGGGAAAEPARSLADIVESGITRALRFDLRQGPDWAAFIALGLALRKRPGGGTPVWVADCLQNAALPGPSRLALIEWWLARQAATDASFASVVKSMRDTRRQLSA